MKTSAVPEKRRLDVNVRTVNARSIIIRPWIARVSVSFLAIGLRHLVHIEHNPARYVIFTHKQVAGSESACLDELVGLRRKGLDDIKGRAEIVKSAIGV